MSENNSPHDSWYSIMSVMYNVTELLITKKVNKKSQLLKLLESLLCDRLRLWAEINDMLPDEQIAYRPGRNTTDHLFSLTLMRELSTADGRKLHSGFIDLRKAFPSVDRQRLINKLSEYGISQRFLSILTRLYANDSFSILLDGVASDKVFRVNSGVHEGSPLSPLLFILFIAGLIRYLERSGVTTNGVKLANGRFICCILYADDVLLLAQSRRGLQILIDLTCRFFDSMGLTVNPEKSDIVIFGSRQGNVRSFDIAGSPKEVRDEAKYLGVIFQRGGGWKCQQESMVTRGKMARGRCEIICKTIGIKRLEQIVQIYDMFVSSVFRYSLGAWGPTAGQLRKIDDIFIDFIRRMYRLPPRTSRNDILAHFGRRCSMCDALFLASVQVARGFVNPGSVWGDVLSTVWNRGDIPWVKSVKRHLTRLDLLEAVVSSPAVFLGDRKALAVDFTRFCFDNHLNITNGRSSDYFRVNRPFGIYPVIFNSPSNRARPLLTLLLSCWRWAYDARSYPDYCDNCDSLINSFHLLFQCRRTQHLRDAFEHCTGRHFTLSTLQSAGTEDAMLRVAEGIIAMVTESRC